MESDLSYADWRLLKSFSAYVNGPAMVPNTFLAKKLVEPKGPSEPLKYNRAISFCAKGYAITLLGLAELEKKCKPFPKLVIHRDNSTYQPYETCIGECR